MASEVQQVETIRSQTLAQLEQLRLSPKPSYSLEGQQVSWTAYAESLQVTIDWCDRKLAEYEPFEIQSEGFTG